MSKNRQTSELINHISVDSSGSIVMTGDIIMPGGSKAATESYVGTAISNLVDSSPATLDTLNELAAALGDDPNFATTVATSIGTKQPQLNGTGFVKATGTTISYDNSTYLTTSSASSTYLPLAGGTLTGALSGTSATFSGTSFITDGSTFRTRLRADAARIDFVNYAQSAFVGGFIEALTLNLNTLTNNPITTGTGTFTVGGALSGTSATFSSTVQATQYTATSTGGSGLRVYGASGTNQWDMYLNGANLRFSDNTGTGSVIFDRPISGTSATFNHNDAPTIRIQRNGGTDTNTVLEFTNASRSFYIGSNGTVMGLGGTSGSVTGQPLQITSTGAATFSSTIRANGGNITVFSTIGAAAFDNGINIITAPGTYTTGHGGILQFQNEDVITAGIRGVRDPGSWASSLLFYTHTSGTGNTFGTTFTEKMRLGDTGNLSVVGNIKTDGVVNWNGTNGALSYGGGAVTMETNTAIPILLKTNGTTAITISTGQAVTFAGDSTFTGVANFNNEVRAGAYALSSLNYIDGTAVPLSTRRFRASQSRTNNDNGAVGLDLTNLQSTNGVYSPIISFSSTTSGGVYNCTYAAIWGVKTSDEGSWAAGDLILGTANPYGVTSRLRITAAGSANFSGAISTTLGLNSTKNIVAGEATPLHLSYSTSDGSGPAVRFGGAQGFWDIQPSSNNQRISFEWSDTINTLSLLSDGRVGITDTDPSRRLSVNFGTSVNDGLIVYGSQRQNTVFRSTGEHCFLYIDSHHNNTFLPRLHFQRSSTTFGDIGLERASNSDAIGSFTESEMVVGSSTSVPFSLKTNGVRRIRMASGGGVEVFNTLSVSGNLTARNFSKFIKTWAPSGGTGSYTTNTYNWADELASVAGNFDSGGYYKGFIRSGNGAHYNGYHFDILVGSIGYGSNSLQFKVQNITPAHSPWAGGCGPTPFGTIDNTSFEHRNNPCGEYLELFITKLGG